MLDRTHRFRRAGTVAAITIAVTALAGCGDGTGPKNKQSALRPAGKYSRQILNLTEPFFWVAVLIGLGVIAGTFFVALRFREKPGEERSPKQVHGNTVLEISWTVVPAVILAIMAVPTVADDLQPRQEAVGTECAFTSRSPRGSGGGSSTTPTRATGSRPRTNCTSRPVSPSR